MTHLGAYVCSLDTIFESLFMLLALNVVYIMFNIVYSGKKKSKPYCVRIQDGKEYDVEEDYCLYLPRPETITKACNHHCKLQWVETHRSNCSEVCGTGHQRIRYKCMKILVDKTKVILMIMLDKMQANISGQSTEYILQTGTAPTNHHGPV